MWREGSKISKNGWHHLWIAPNWNIISGYERPLGVLPSVFNTDDQQSSEILSQDATDREVDSNRQARQIFFPR